MVKPFLRGTRGSASRSGVPEWVAREWFQSVKKIKRHNKAKNRAKFTSWQKKFILWGTVCALLLYTKRSDSKSHAVMRSGATPRLLDDTRKPLRQVNNSTTATLSTFGD